jgi:hypothetical protein
MEKRNENWINECSVISTTSKLEPLAPTHSLIFEIVALLEKGLTVNELKEIKKVIGKEGYNKCSSLVDLINKGYTADQIIKELKLELDEKNESMDVYPLSENGEQHLGGRVKKKDVLYYDKHVEKNYRMGNH